MSDPFGDDEVDFNLEAFLQTTYENAIQFMRDERAPLADALPDGLRDPLRGDGSGGGRFTSTPSHGSLPRGTHGLLTHPGTHSTK